MHNKKELDERMREAGIQPLKKLGQNFLLNPKICAAIVEGAASFTPHTVVEVGPGLGALTDELARGPWKLKLVELDGGLAKFWSARLPLVPVIHEDALQLDWKAQTLPQPAVLVSNLPYSIAASLVVELSSFDFEIFSGLVLMFQKEVAQRIQAATHDEDYGLLSVVAQTHWDVDQLIDAGPQDFYPVPNVGSRVLSFKWRSGPHPGPEFTKFVKLAFSQRRKKLGSNLQGGFSKEGIQRAFSEMSLKDTCRAQELAPPELLRLFKKLVLAD